MRVFYRIKRGLEKKGTEEAERPKPPKATVVGLLKRFIKKQPPTSLLGSSKDSNPPKFGG
jgi:hypothetical protein